MRTRRGSSIGSNAYRAADTFAVGDVVTPIIVGGKDTFYGVVTDVNAKTNRVIVIWNTGYASQHEPDELLLAMGVDSVLRERLMGLAAARRKTAARRMSGRANEVIATNPSLDTFSGNPATHGLETPVSGGSDVMKELQKKLHEESIQNQGKVSKLHKRRGSQEKTAESVTMRRAVYHRERGRVYKPTRSERESGTYRCPKCREELEQESFCRGIKLFKCPKCSWKILSDRVVMDDK